MSPCREGQPAAGTEHARELSHGALGAREVHDRQVADNSVEGCVCERQLVRIRATELNPRVSVSSTRDHRLRDVDAHH
jgi:hypothetical protein